MQVTAGYYKGMKILCPSEYRTRPTGAKIRSAIWDMLQTQLHGASILDLFAGSGAIGIEGLSRGAKSVVFVESHKSCIGLLKKNLAELRRRASVMKIKEPMLTLVAADCYHFVVRRSFDIVWADPPYAMACEWLSRSWPKLSDTVATGGSLLLEISKKDLSQVIELVQLDAAFELVKQKIYGDTAVLWFTKKSV